MAKAYKKSSKPKKTSEELRLENIIALMMSNEGLPWRRPSGITPPENLKTGHPYNGFNTLLLASYDHPDPYYVTFMQAKALGGYVGKKGNGQGIPIFLYKWLYYDAKGNYLKAPPQTASKAEIKAFEAKVDKKIPYLNHSHVFNAALHCEGLEPHLEKRRELALRNKATPEERHAKCATLLKGLHQEVCPIYEVGNQAAYYVESDVIGLVAPESYLDNMAKSGSPIDAYYAVALHEYAHATGHLDRLARSRMITETRHEKNARNIEELVAEITAAELSQKLGISNEIMANNSGAYLSSWNQAIRDDPELLVNAYKQAMPAVKWIMNEKRIPAKLPPDLEARRNRKMPPPFSDEQLAADKMFPGLHPPEKEVKAKDEHPSVVIESNLMARISSRTGMIKRPAASELKDLDKQFNDKLNKIEKSDDLTPTGR